MKSLLILFFLIFWSSCSEQQDSSINSIDSPDNENIVIAEECNEDGQLIFDADKEQHFFCLGASKEWIPLRYDSLLKVESRISKTEDVSVFWKSIDSLVISWENGDSSVSVEPWNYIPEFPQGDFEKFDGFTVIQDSIFRNSCAYVEGEWLVYVRNDKRFYRCASSQWEAMEFTEVKQVLQFSKSFVVEFENGKLWNVSEKYFGNTVYFLGIVKPTDFQMNSKEVVPKYSVLLDRIQYKSGYTLPVYFDLLDQKEYVWIFDRWEPLLDSKNLVRHGPGGYIEEHEALELMTVNGSAYYTEGYIDALADTGKCLLAWVQNGEIIKNKRQLSREFSFMETNLYTETFFSTNCEIQVDVKIHEGVIGTDTTIHLNKNEVFYYKPKFEEGFVLDYCLVGSEKSTKYCGSSDVLTDTKIEVFAKKYVGFPLESESFKHAICFDYMDNMGGGCWVPYSDKLEGGSSRFLIPLPESENYVDVDESLEDEVCPIWENTRLKCTPFWALPMAYQDSQLNLVTEVNAFVDSDMERKHASVGWIYISELDFYAEDTNYIKNAKPAHLIQESTFSFEFRYPLGKTLTLALVQRDKIISNENTWKLHLMGTGDWEFVRVKMTDFLTEYWWEMDESLSDAIKRVIGFAIVRMETNEPNYMPIQEDQTGQRLLEIRKFRFPELIMN